MSRKLDNLDLDSRRAVKLGYGVHYGNYKADHPCTMERREAAEPVGDGKEYPMKECEWCGEKFPMTRKARRFCCDDCRNAARKSKKGKEVDLSKARLTHCQLCSAPITDKKMRRYCSPECAHEANRRRSNKSAQD